jgi:hypothetical protein
MKRYQLIDNIVTLKLEYLENHTILKNRIDYFSLSFNLYLPFSFVMKNIDKTWNWNIIIENLNIKSNIVKSNLDKLWNSRLINSSNQNLNIINEIENHSDKDSDWWFIISTYPNITWDIVINYLDKPWDWCMLLGNSSFLCSEEEICNAYLKNKMTIRIQRAFLQSYYNPDFEICRKRLLKEYNEMKNKQMIIDI